MRSRGFNLSGVHFWGKVHLDDNIRHPRRTRCQARGAPLPPTRLHLSRWPAPSFRLVPGSLIRQRAAGGKGEGRGGGWMSMPHRRHRPTLLVREIARYTGRQPSSPRIPFPRPKGGKSRVPRENRVGGGGDGRGRDGERGMARFSERWPSGVSVINSHRPPADGPRIEFTRCIRVLERIGRLFKRMVISTTSLPLGYVHATTYVFEGRS